MPHSSFSPKARWDRRVPGASEDNPEFLNETIEVLAWFKRANIYPKEFIWHGKAYEITKITYNWQERRGQELISYFSVNSGPDLYQLSFNNTTYSWKLDKIIS